MSTIMVVPHHWSESKGKYMPDPTSEWQEMTIAEFCKANPDLCSRVRRMRAGETLFEGGGAAGAFEVRKISTSKKRWIQRALKYHKKGALHRQLGIPADEKIPIGVLKSAARKPGKLGRRARLALNLRNVTK